MRPARLAARRYVIFSASSSFSLPAAAPFKLSATLRLSAYMVSAYVSARRWPSQGPVGRSADSVISGLTQIQTASRRTSGRSTREVDRRQEPGRLAGLGEPLERISQSDQCAFGERPA